MEEEQKMKENLVWTKTILTVYRYLERVSGAIDKIVLRSGLGSGNIYGQNYLYNNVLSISQKIIDLSDRKIALINLKVLTEDILKKLKSEDVKILLDRYVDGRKYKDICLRNNISLRTVYRRLEASEIAFARFLNVRGFASDELFNMLKSEKWILSVYNHIKEKSEDFSVSASFLARAVSM